MALSPLTSRDELLIILRLAACLAVLFGGMIFVVVRGIMARRYVDEFHKLYPNAPEVILPPSIAINLKVKSVNGKKPIAFTKGNMNGFLVNVGVSTIEAIHPESKKIVRLSITALDDERHFIAYNSATHTVFLKYEGDKIPPHEVGIMQNSRHYTGLLVFVCSIIFGATLATVACHFWAGPSAFTSFAYWKPM